MVVDPSLSPFIPTITIAFGGRHLSRMQPFSLIPNLYRARTFFIFDLMTPPKGKAKTSSVGEAATFPEREGSDLFRRQKPTPSPKGKAVTSSVGKADTFPEREGKVLFRRQADTFPEREGFLPRETNIISGKIAEIFIRFKIVRIYIIILLLLLFLPFSIDLKPENMYNNIDITL